jgi:threonine dehydrogenase-like Zn-dependent dehydrogenase
MVMGLGILGQLAVAYARAAGAYPVIACDPIEERRNEAMKNGADYAFNPFDKDFVEQVKSITNGGVNAAIEVTGVGAGLDETLDCMAKFGRVALLGCTRNSDFSIDFYRKVHGPGITLIGAHTNARPQNESYPSYFTHIDDIKTALSLCCGRRLDLKHLIKETHNPMECQDVYTRLATEKNFPICVQFDWRNE